MLGLDRLLFALPPIRACNWELVPRVCTNLPPYRPHPILPVSILTAPPHHSFNISTQKFPKLLYLLKLQVGPKSLCLLFFQTRLPRAMARMATGGPHF